MTEKECASLARRYARYLNIKIMKSVSLGSVWLIVDGYLFSSYKSFLFGRNDRTQRSFNETVSKRLYWRAKILEYSSAEELDFKLSVMGF